MKADSLVVKAGGNVLFPRATNEIDRPFVQCLSTYLRKRLLDDYRHVVLIPGGVGGELFIKWGRAEGCSESELNQIGCVLINMTAVILNQALRTLIPDDKVVCPSVPTSLDALKLGFDHYRVFTVGSKS